MLAGQNAIVNLNYMLFRDHFLYWPTLKNLIFLKLDILNESKAEVAKLVDALDSESSPVKGVGVRVPSSALHSIIKGPVHRSYVYPL